MRAIYFGVLFSIGVLVAADTSELRASGPIAAYAIVENVVMEPNDTTADRIQVWGVFMLETSPQSSSYASPQRGYLYFSCKPGKEEICRKEWADLKTIAGTDQIVGFGSRQEASPRVRKAEDKAANPDEYPINFGLVKVSDRRSDQAPIRELKSLPKEKN